MPTWRSPLPLLGTLGWGPAAAGPAGVAACCSCSCCCCCSGPLTGSASGPAAVGVLPGVEGGPCAGGPALSQLAATAGEGGSGSSCCCRCIARKGGLGAAVACPAAAPAAAATGWRAVPITPRGLRTRTDWSPSQRRDPKAAAPRTLPGSLAPAAVAAMAVCRDGRGCCDAGAARRASGEPCGAGAGAGLACWGPFDPGLLPSPRPAGVSAGACALAAAARSMLSRRSADASPVVRPAAPWAWPLQPPPPALSTPPRRAPGPAAPASRCPQPARPAQPCHASPPERGPSSSSSESPSSSQLRSSGQAALLSSPSLSLCSSCSAVVTSAAAAAAAAAGAAKGTCWVLKEEFQRQVGCPQTFHSSH
jgi:hypothetical protein